jgi:hypothetical protein
MVCRGIRVEFSDMRVAGVSLKSKFDEAVKHWRELETKKAKEILEYMSKHYACRQVQQELMAVRIFLSSIS